MSLQLAENAVVAGRFRLNHQIGRGGMGSVWHATHLGLDIPCAVKFIEGDYAPMAEAQTRFEREAKAAALLRSPHVVQILDHGIWDGTPYIAMELLEGEDLGKRLQKVVRLSPREAHGIVAQVCRALTKAHALGIVHRDLKPDNIFLVGDDDREIAKVLDFGIAKRDANAIQGSNTKTGAMLGTPYYMSPEQAQGIRSVDSRSDLWSLAVIVYQCMTGLLPFESEALGDLLMKIIVQPLPVPSLHANVPLGFDNWWARAASREPSGRFQSAKEFGDSLGLVCGISQVSGVSDRSDVYSALGGAPPQAAGTGPHTGATPKALSATTGGAMAQTYASDADAKPRRRAARPFIWIGAGGIVAAIGVAAALLSSPGKRGAAAPASGPLDVAAAAMAGSPPAASVPSPPAGIVTLATTAPEPSPQPSVAQPNPGDSPRAQAATPVPKISRASKGPPVKPAPASTKVPAAGAPPAKGDLGF